MGATFPFEFPTTVFYLQPEQRATAALCWFSLKSCLIRLSYREQIMFILLILAVEKTIQEYYIINYYSTTTYYNYY